MGNYIVQVEKDLENEIIVILVSALGHYNDK
jgi:hypothetical protein